MQSGADPVPGDNPGTNNREIVISRFFDFPRPGVWRAWTEPEHLSRWWGPDGFTNTFHEFDLRPGGVWRFVMHGPDGTDYRNKSIFREIVPPGRLVFDHVSGHHFQAIATFEEKTPELTLVTYRMVHPTAEHCKRVKAIVGPANDELFDRLEAELVRMG